MYINVHESVKCSFYEEFFRLCSGSPSLQSKLRNRTSCSKLHIIVHSTSLEVLIYFQVLKQIINEKFFVDEHHCPGDLQFKDDGPAFPPTCSSPQLQTEFLTSTCLPQNGR